MKSWTRIAGLVALAAFLAGALCCAGSNSPGSKQAQLLKRMQTSHSNH
jgi:hypothetical protein